MTYGFDSVPSPGQLEKSLLLVIRIGACGVYDGLNTFFVESRVSISLSVLFVIELSTDRHVRRRRTSTMATLFILPPRSDYPRFNPRDNTGVSLYVCWFKKIASAY